MIASFYPHSALDLTDLGGMLFFGFLIGLVMHRSRFCFVRAFRCPFLTGDAEMVDVAAMSLIICDMGTAAIKRLWYQEPSTGVNHHFWIGSLSGGVIFGVGMLFAGGCASSTLWRVGEGQAKMVLTMVALALTNSLLVGWIERNELGGAVDEDRSETVPLFADEIDWDDLVDRIFASNISSMVVAPEPAATNRGRTTRRAVDISTRIPLTTAPLPFILGKEGSN